MKKPTLQDRGHAFRKKAWPRFRKGHNDCKESECLFCNGWTWGAVEGFRAGYMAARRDLKRR